MSAPADLAEVEVLDSVPLADAVTGITLRPLAGLPVPETAPGSHVRLRLPSGLERSYSLVNAPGERKHYRIAVQCAEDGRGGSREMAGLRPGDRLWAATPANAFRLHEGEGESVLIAGGIGITPIWSMIQHLEAAGRPWRLFYGARNRDRAAFLDALSNLEAARPGRVTLAFSDEETRLDIPAAVASTAPDGHVYCCGPQYMLTAFRDSTGHMGERAHSEDFEGVGAPEGGFEVRLARSGKSLVVAEGSSILEAVLEAGVEPAYSCMGGTCGSCETPVLGGVPDHRDMVLTDEEKESGDKMIICCSGCVSGPLILDL
ncbi:PDR/VanB family oxidoreductase [Streptomyces fuscichromogenes]|uniref:PDR/VanB family oxidoreductase n=1 Tax=Streptomyces fuscichromogenes TaxID=1324013 RepID=UPI003803A649